MVILRRPTEEETDGDSTYAYPITATTQSQKSAHMEIPGPRLRLQTEKVGSDSGGESCSILFLEVAGNTGIIGKTDVGKKNAILSHFPS